MKGRRGRGERRSTGGLRRRLVITFALVAAAASVGVALTSYLLVRQVTLQRATDAAVRESLLDLDEAAERLPPSPTTPEVEALNARLQQRGAFDVVALLGDGSFATTSFSLSAASVPATLRDPVAAGRVASVRTTVSGSPSVVVGGRVLPDGPSLFFFFPLADDLAELTLVRNVLAGASGTLVALSAGVGALAASSLLRPIRRTRAAVQSVEAGHLDARLPEDGGDELAELARSFNRMAETLQRTVGQLQDLESSHRRFVADVSHELRTPLTALTTAADVLEANADGLNDTGRRAAQLLLIETRRLRTLVEDLMEISRLDAGAAVMFWSLVDVADALTLALEVRGWDRQVEVRVLEAVTTWADPRRLDAILANLVGNALEHGRPPVVVSASADAHHLAIEVADTGGGIAEEHLPHVFDRFYKADPARSRRDGSGLGLAIARENARLHGGDLTVSSGAGGARFTLMLPRRQAPPDEAEAGTTVAQSLHAGEVPVTQGADAYPNVDQRR